MAIKLVAFDLDGVLLDCLSSWEWVHRHYGVSNEENHELFKKGLIDDMEFIKRDVEKWRRGGKYPTAEELERIARSSPLMKNAVYTLKTLKESGLKVGIISGGLRPAAERVAEEAGGLDFLYANWLVVEDGRITPRGEVDVWLRDKRSVLESVQKKFGVSPPETASVGDSYVDIGLFERSGLKIAFNPSSDELVRMADVVITEKDLALILPHILRWRSFP